MSAYALKAYRTAEVDARCEDSDKRQLVIMMYDGAIDAIGLAKAHAERGEHKAVSAAASRAMTIIAGLRETLDLAKGGSVATHLNDFYQFLNRKLMRSSASASIADLGDCQDLLAQVREAWAAISPVTAGQVNRNMFVIHS
jgi:flagellar protein FliS